MRALAACLLCFALAPAAVASEPREAAARWIRPVDASPGRGYRPHPSISGAEPHDFPVAPGTRVVAANHGRVALVWRNPDPAPWNAAGRGADEPINGHTFLSLMRDARGKLAGGFGHHVILEHRVPSADGTLAIARTAYCHLRRVDVREGQEVAQGELIGLSGGDEPTRAPAFRVDPRTREKVRKGYRYFSPFGPDGTSSGPHLHYEGPLPR